jgi:hypothetical protein
MSPEPPHGQPYSPGRACLRSQQRVSGWTGQSRAVPGRLSDHERMPPSSAEGRLATLIAFAKAKITGQKYTGSENETVTMTG